MTGRAALSFDEVLRIAEEKGARYPRLVAAQYQLESGGGKHLSGANNPFGIKDPGGTVKTTQEVVNGKTITTQAGFKNFGSTEEAIQHLVDRWYKDYKGYKGVNNAPDLASAARMLKEQGYATDPNYASKLIKIAGAPPSAGSAGAAAMATGPSAVPAAATAGLLDAPTIRAAVSPEAAAAGGGMGAILLDSAALSGLQDPAGARLAKALVADLELGSAAAKASTGGDGLELVSALAAAPAGQAVAANGRMAGGALGVIGRVADPSEQPYLPSTGAHLDARVIKPDGTYVNPESARSILQNLHVGGKPLYSQSSDGQWVAAAPITSRFGPRNAPTAGASSLHRGTDYGLAAGTQLKWVGPGTVSHQRGYRSIKTPEGYEIRLLHTEAA